MKSKNAGANSAPTAANAWQSWTMITLMYFTPWSTTWKNKPRKREKRPSNACKLGSKTWRNTSIKGKWTNLLRKTSWPLIWCRIKRKWWMASSKLFCSYRMRWRRMFTWSLGLWATIVSWRSTERSKPVRSRAENLNMETLAILNSMP